MKISGIVEKMRILKRKSKNSYIVQTLVTTFLLGVAFASMVGYLYAVAKEDGYEHLHVQTKQIKDSIILQMVSDQENLETMANFASKLYNDGGDYHLLFESFKPIGLIRNIGILNPDNVFESVHGELDLNGLISFEEEAQRGTYISGREKDLTQENHEIIRSAVPIKSDDEVVGILYGVICMEDIGAKYDQMAQELDAQLFVYEKTTGDLVIDTVHDTLGNISFLKDRIYLDGYSYEEMMATDKGYTSFVSAYRAENVHLHYSTMEELNWMIALVRYDAHVFTGANKLFNALLVSFVIMAIIVTLFIWDLVQSERRITAVSTYTSEIQKTLLETSERRDQIEDALRQVCQFAKARSVVFFDTDGEEYAYVDTPWQSITLDEKDKQNVMADLFRYATEAQHENDTTIAVQFIKCNEKLAKENEMLYQIMRKNKLRSISFSATISNSNHIVILAVFNAKRIEQVRILEGKIAPCFSIAMSNRKRYYDTKRAAAVDALTGTLNRVAYNNDMAKINLDDAVGCACIYVDVNELHLRNNLYGHAAGDEMLVCVANTLKEVFFGQKVYRMGGDEFLVFCQDIDQEKVQNGIVVVKEQLERRDYHVSIGMSYQLSKPNIGIMVYEAERLMYEDKALYYQKKEKRPVVSSASNGYVHMKTGIAEIDTMLSVMPYNYGGIYRVSLDTDRAKRILMPKAFQYDESAPHFAQLYSKYVAEDVMPEYRRKMLSVLNYDALKQQMKQGQTPTIQYKKADGENMVMRIHWLLEDNKASDTLWVFSKE